MICGACKENIESLPFRRREVVKLRYGVGDGYCYTPDAIARIFKITPERTTRQAASLTGPGARTTGCSNVP